MTPKREGRGSSDGATPRTKVCTRCGRRRPLPDFGPDPRYADGLRPHCIRCRVEYTSAWRETHHEAFVEGRREYDARPDVKERRLARDRARAARRRREQGTK